MHGSRCHWQIGPKTAEETSPNGRPANKIRNFFVIASKERVRGRSLTTCRCLLDLLFSGSRNDSWLPNDPPLHAQTDRYQEQRLRIVPERANIRPAEGRYSLLSVQDGSAPLTKSAPPARKRPALSESSDIVPPPPGNLITRVLSPPGHRPVRSDLIISQLPSIAPPVKSCPLALPPACATL